MQIHPAVHPLHLSTHAGSGLLRAAMSWTAALLGLLGLLAGLSARAEVRLPDGQWFEQTEDLRVKVMGGYVAVSRTWLADKWYFNSAWAGLTFRYDSLGQISTIERSGWKYEQRGAGVWAFDSKNSIFATASGYRWQDRHGNSIDYDSSGKIVSYADRNAVKVGFTYDPAKRITGVFDHFGNQVLWFEHALAADQVLALQVVAGADFGQPSAVRDASGRRVEYRYSNARLAAVIDVLGHEWGYTYDGSGRLSSRTDPQQRTLSLAYGANARISTVTQADGAATAYSYDYDSAKREVVVQILHPGGRQEQMWYGVNGVLRRQEIAGQLSSGITADSRSLVRIDANDAQTKEELDEWDNLIKRTHPDGSVQIFEREPRFSEVSRYVDENGIQTRYDYDTRGNRTRRIEAVGTPQERTTEFRHDDYGNRILALRLSDPVSPEAVVTYAYDEAGNLVTAIGPEGNLSRYTYDIQGNLTSFTDGLTHTWRYEYDNAGRLVSETDPLGQVAHYAYDTVGNLTSYTDRTAQVWRYEYDRRDHLIARVDPLGNSARIEYSQEGDPIHQIDEDGHGRQLRYDPLRRLRSMTDGRGNIIEMRYPQTPAEGTSSFGPNHIVYPTLEQDMRYDKRNRVTAVSDILGQEVRLTRYQYDKAGKRTAVINAEGNTTVYAYDALNRLVQIIDTLGHTSRFAYDNRDNLIAVTDANAHAWRFEYDRANRRTSESRPRGETTRFRYDAADQLVELTDAKGQHLVYDYDANGRLSTERHYASVPSGLSPAKQVTYAYDAQSNLTAWSDGEQSATIAYDALARVASETVSFGPFRLAYGYTYHANGLKKSMTYPDGTTYLYQYSEHNQLSTVDIPGEGSITVNDFRWTAPRQITLPGGVVQHYELDGLLRTTGQQVVSPAATTLLSVNNEYGALRQLLKRDIDGTTTVYGYDSETRLLEAKFSGGAQELYTLDPVTNRLSDNAIPGTREHDQNNRLLKAGDTTYDYDANGNLTQKAHASQSIRFFYDIADRLIRVEDGAGTVIARYGYDPQGRRMWKRVGQSIAYFLYAQEGLIGEYNALGQQTAAYGWRPDGIWGTDPLFYRLGNRTFYTHNDHLGAPLRLSDVRGTVVWQATYKAFGEAAVGAASTVTYNLRLPGQYFDSETGLHQNWVRYYEPESGRYTAEDPIGLGGGPNTYVYALGDPSGTIDPSGLKYCAFRQLNPASETSTGKTREALLRYDWETRILLEPDPSVFPELSKKPKAPWPGVKLRVERRPCRIVYTEREYARKVFGVRHCWDDCTKELISTDPWYEDLPAIWKPDPGEQPRKGDCFSWAPTREVSSPLSPDDLPEPERPGGPRPKRR